MKTALFDFTLPADRIASRPAVPRESARLLCVSPDRLDDRRVEDLPAQLRRGDLLVVNDTRVIPAQLTGRRGDAKIEATLHRRLGAGRWRAFARPARRLRPGQTVRFGDGFEARVEAMGERGEAVLDFALADSAFDAALARHGATPLPPYVKRPAGADARDARDYQTVFARRPGAVAAPTAGLHFTPRLLERLAAAGVARAAITLHVGAGTFRPVAAEDTRDHEMHAEWGAVDAATAAAVAETKARGGRVVAVGTTAARILETAARDGAVSPFAGDTDLFIAPGYRFRAVDALLTNFHLPRSTLFMLVCAFGGVERVKEAYAHAIVAGYRFYSYGDACLLRPEGAP